MLTKAVTTTMLPVADVERASRFYTEKLGLHQRLVAGDGTLILDAGNGDGSEAARILEQVKAEHLHVRQYVIER